MKSVIAMVGGLFFVAALGAAPLFAADDDYVSGCVPQKKSGENKKNAKLKRVAVGTTPDNGDCKKKQVPVTMPTKTVTDGLQTQVSQNADDIGINVGNIATNTTNISNNANDIDTNAGNIATNTTNIANNRTDIDQNTSDIGDNADMIDNIKAGLISSMIGGGHNSTSDGGRTLFMPLFNWFAGASDAEEKMASKVAVTGWLTDLVVIQNEATGADAGITYRYMVDGSPIDLSPLVADNFCVTTGDSGDESTMCESVGCYKITKGQKLSVREIAADAGSPPHVSPTRWTGRFVETDAECEPL